MTALAPDRDVGDDVLSGFARIVGGRMRVEGFEKRKRCIKLLAVAPGCCEERLAVIGRNLLQVLQNEFDKEFAGVFLNGA